MFLSLLAFFANFCGCASVSLPLPLSVVLACVDGLVTGLLVVFGLTFGVL
jgi:hypothetical protein